MPSAVTCEMMPVEDIEDLFSKSNLEPIERLANHTQILPKVKKRSVKETQTQTDLSHPVFSSIIPGNCLCFILTAY